MNPTPLVPGLRKHLRQGPPQAHGPVAHDEFRIAHAAPAAVPQQVGPGLGRLPQPLGQGDQLLGAVQAHAHQDQDAGVGLTETDPGVDAVGPHVDVVALRQVASLEGGVVVLPLLREPVHRGRRQAGRGAEELLERGHEVAAGQSVQVEQQEYLADFRGLAAPRRLGAPPGRRLGEIFDENRCRSPLASSTRRSFTRGARTSTGPAAVVTVRGRWCPLRTTRRRPRSSRSAANSAMYWSTSASSAAASIRLAPSRTISSIREPADVVPSSLTTLSTGVPSRPALRTRA